MFFGLEATMIAMTTDASRGVTDRFRSLPMSQSAVLSGRSAADLLNAVLGLAVMTAAGLLVGWRFEAGIANAALAFALLLLLRLAVIWVGIYLGLRIEAEGVVAVQILVWPVGFLSSVFVAPSTMPVWLGAIAE
jgi:ABC-2 type transport system permease protein